MAASKPTSSLSRHEHILRYTQRPLWGLSCGSGFFPSRRWTLSLSDCLPRSISQVFGVWLGLVGRSGPRAHPVALPPANMSRGSTSIDFGENQLSPGLIGLSPLPTSHPSGFQPTPVRASTGCYPSFTLLMGRSPWLRVYTRVLQFPLVSGLAFALAPPATGLASHPSSNSPDHNAKGTQSGDIASEDTSSLLPLVGMWFQDLFHSPHWGAFHLSLTVLVHYRSHGSLSPWRVVPPASRPITRVGRYSGTPLGRVRWLRLPGSHRLRPPVPGAFRCRRSTRPWVLQPRASCEARFGRRPRSLAATWGISIDSSSSGY